MKWGYTTSSEKQTKPAPINARAETVATMPLFREAFRRRRCLVVADGFYEWRKDGNTKTPYLIRLRSERPLGFAAIWASMRTAMGQRIGTCAILTCPPNELMAPIHNRIPVILPTGARDRWLEPQANVAELQSLLTPFPADQMEAYPVSTLVNSPRNDTFIANAASHSDPNRGMNTAAGLNASYGSGADPAAYRSPRLWPMRST
jgi:putative SOS response-associated peptidase YedK